MNDDFNKIVTGIIVAFFAIAVYCCETPSSTPICSNGGVPYQTCEVQE